MINKAVIDFSAFVNENREFIVKELSISDIESRCCQHWVFKSPKVRGKDVCGYLAEETATERHNKWLAKHYHGLEKHMGNVEYETLYPTLDNICSNVRVLYAANTEKARTLEKILHGRRVVVSLELMGCPPPPRDILLPPSEQSSKQCLIHHIYAPGFCCTLENVRNLTDWCSENLQHIDMDSAVNREKTFRDWKCIVPSTKELADQGFVQCSTVGDSTKCVYCGVILFRWVEGDKAADDHEYNSPNCALIHHLRGQREGVTIANRLARRLCCGIDETDCRDSTHTQPSTTSDEAEDLPITYRL